MHSLQMGDCIRSAARRSYREGVQRYDFAEPRWNANNRSHLLVHREGHRVRWRHFAEGVQSRHPGGDLRRPCRHDHFTAQWHRRYSIFGSRQGERRLHSLQMGDCFRSAALRCHRESVQHYDFAEPRWNADDRRYLLLHREGHRVRWRHFADARTKSSSRWRHPAALPSRPLHCPMAPSVQHIRQSSRRAAAALPTNGRLHPERCPPVSPRKRPALRLR